METVNVELAQKLQRKEAERVCAVKSANYLCVFLGFLLAKYAIYIISRSLSSAKQQSLGQSGP